MVRSAVGLAWLALAASGAGVALSGGPRVLLRLDPGRAAQVIGAVEGGRWTPADAAKAASFPDLAGRSFRVLGGGTLTGVAARPDDVPCERNLVAPVAARPSGTRFARSGPEPLQPRPVVALSTANPVYVRAVADVLRAAGLANPRVVLRSVWRADLDGNGTQEVVVSAARHADAVDGVPGPNAAAGDYALVLVREATPNGVRTTLLHKWVALKSAVFSAPSTANAAAVLDVDGDGRLEVVVNGEYYEGGWTTVYAAPGGRWRAVLEWGCGV